MGIHYPLYDNSTFLRNETSLINCQISERGDQWNMIKFRSFRESREEFQLAGNDTLCRREERARDPLTSISRMGSSGRHIHHYYPTPSLSVERNVSSGDWRVPDGS